MEPPASEPPPSDPPQRLDRRQRRLLVRQTFGTRLLTTFAILLSLVTTLVFGIAGLLMHHTNDTVLERQVTSHLESVAQLAAREMRSQGDALELARHPSPIVQRAPRRKLARICAELREDAQVAEVVVFTVSGLEAGGEVEVLGATAEDQTALLGRLLADSQLAVAESVERRRPVSSSIWSDEVKSPEGSRWRVFKSAYMPVVIDEVPVAVVGVELPAEFAAAVAEVDNTFLILVALAGLIVLLAAVLLVRQRVHLPVYRLVRAMERDDGPVQARVRHNDEIGVLTEHYNLMVERLVEKDHKLRELYDQARETAVYLQGYSNSLVAGVPEGVVAVDPEGNLTVWNASAQAILRETHPLGAPHPDAEHPLARALRSALDGSATDQALFVIEVPGEASEDEEERQRLVELTCAPFSSDDGELLGAVALVSDRTELERFRRSAARNERLGAIGSLGGGLAHEIKNPLGAMSGFAELIERKAGPDVARLAKRLRQQVGELNTFLNEFLAFARDDKVRREPTDLSDLVRRSAIQALLEQGLGEADVEQAMAGAAVPLGEGELTLTLELDPLPELALDALLMKTVLVNLMRNACQAMPQGGTLLVRTHRVGQGVYVRVRDNGPGIPLEDRERVFDPLYTTRAEGTGLGLAICNKSIAAHGGKLSVRDAPGGGAELVVRIPLVVASPGTTQAPAVAGGA